MCTCARRPVALAVLCCLVCAGLFGCAGGTSAASTGVPAPVISSSQEVPPPTQGPVPSITISCPMWDKSDPFQQRREELFAQSGVQVHLVYTPVKRDNGEYLDNAISGASSGEAVDGYLLLDWQVPQYIEHFSGADLSDAVQQYAPSLAEFYDKMGVKAPYYSLPIGMDYSQDARYCVAVAQALVEKYNPTIHTVADYYAFLDTIRDKEPDYVPGMLDPLFSAATLLTDSGYVDAGAFLHSTVSRRVGLYFRPADPLGTLRFAEDIPEYQTALWKIKQRLDSHELCIYDANISEPLATVPLNLSNVCMDCYTVDNPLDRQVWNMKLFPVQRDVMSAALPSEPLGTLVLSPYTQKKADVMRFVQWLVTDAQHYQAAQYGEQGREYTLQGSAVSPLPNGSVSYNLSGLAAYLRITQYDLPTVTEPINATGLVGQPGLSQDAISGYIATHTGQYLCQRDELDKKLGATSYKALLDARGSQLQNILYTTMSQEQMQSALSHLQKSDALIDDLKSFISTIIKQ